MFKRLTEQEAGIALPLAIMMIVIIGVMGAGLLVFVTTDLGGVLESNQGQKAFNLADAGVQAAKSHLMADAYFLKYDGVTDTAANPPNFESAWSCGNWNPVAKTCPALGKTPDLDPGSGNTVKVWIQYLQPATTTAQANDSTGVYAPAVTPSGQANYPVGTDYFKVISQATVGQTKRKVEAIYNTVSLDAPRAYFTSGSIKIAGGAVINNISLFSLHDITFTGQATVSGKDLAYGKWAATSDSPNITYTPNYDVSFPNSYNNHARLSDAAGLGAVGDIGNADEVAGRDYDVDPNPGTSFSATNPKFVQTLSATPQPAGEITFPFSPNPNIPSLSDLASAAQAQTGSGIGGSNYYQITSNMDVRESGAVYTGPKWPANSTVGTVVYVKFTNGSSPTSNKLTWNLAGNCGTAPVRGTLVVENGTVDTSNSNKAPLKGTVIIRGVPSDPSHPAYSDTGGACMQVFVNASGDIKLAGNVSPGTLERGNAAGTYSLKLASWRELYQ
jgi:Tfp pilus assembly protein PilX